MSQKQIAVGEDAHTKPFDPIHQESRLATIDNILVASESLCGCWHRNVSRQFTLSDWTYEVCLDCGKKFAFDRAEIGRGAAA